MSKKVLLIFLSLGLVLVFSRTLAQERPLIWLTWRAYSYAPADFGGKVLPAPGSLVRATIETVRGNVPINLDGETIYWYLNGAFLKGGEGVREVSFRPTREGLVELSVQIPSLGATVIKAVAIPVARPEAVVVAPFPRSTFSESKIQLRAEPFFFNVASLEDLKFFWKVNGQEPTSVEDPVVLDIGLDAKAPSNFRLGVELRIQGPRGGSESASRFLELKFVK